MKNYYKIPLLLFAFELNVLIIGAQGKNEEDLKYYLSNLPFQMPEVNQPSFPDRQVNITDFGAIGNGQAMNTDAFAKAIDTCAKSGGGTVIVPPGIWLTGPIKFQSNINLHLEKGALILFSRNHRDFPIILNPITNGLTVASPIYGFILENIAITGDGIIDGAGDSWRPVKKSKTTENQWKSLVASGGAVSADNATYWPTKEAMEGEAYLKNLISSGKPLTEKDYEPARDFLRPYMVLFYQCKKVLLDGPTFQNSPKFVLYPTICEDVIIRNIKVLNEWWAQNGDGIDISGGKNILIYNCLVNAGDDGICMKSSKNKYYKSEPVLQNVLIFNCVVYHAHGGFVIGSNTDGGMKNISVNNCNFISTDIGLRFKSSRGRGGLVENIYVNNIYMKDIATQAILFDTYYESPEDAVDNAVAVNEKTPKFQKFYMNKIYCNGTQQAIKITGLPEMPISDIDLKNIVISANAGFTSKEAQNIRLDNVVILPEKEPVFELTNCNGFLMKDISYPKGSKTFMKLEGKTTNNIQLSGTNVSDATKSIIFGQDVDKKAVVLK
jgi:DNA sulfur modification protein DndE